MTQTDAITHRHTGVTPEHFRDTLGHFASGVTIVTALSDNQPIGLTVQSFCSVSLHPPLVLVCPSKTSTSWPSIATAGAFCVNVLSEEQEACSRVLSRSGTDKFSTVAYDLTPATLSPRIIGASAWLDCEISAIHDGGDHHVVIARVVDLDADHTARPLTFWRGSYAKLA